MYLIPFAAVFPQQAEKETRVLLTRGYPALPDDEYALIEAYCPDPQCDCRRVMLNVVRRRHPRKYLPSVSFGFDREKEDAGPFLDPLNRQSLYAGALLPLVVRVLDENPYVSRLESHYQQLKHAAADPQDPAHDRVRRIGLGKNHGTASDGRKTTTVRKKKRRRR